MQGLCCSARDGHNSHQKKTPKKTIIALEVIKDSKLSEKVHKDFFLNPNKKEERNQLYIFFM